MAVAVQLKGIRELVAGAGEECIMCHVDGVADSIHRERIVEDGMRGRIAMVFSHDVVPRSRSETLERDAG